MKHRPAAAEPLSVRPKWKPVSHFQFEQQALTTPAKNSDGNACQPSALETLHGGQLEGYQWPFASITLQSLSQRALRSMPTVAKEPGAWLTEKMRLDIKQYMEHAHGVVPSDDDINWISDAEESAVRKLQTTDHNHRASDLLMEASACYRHGCFNACIMMARSAVEVALQTSTAKRGRLHELIRVAQKRGLLEADTARMAHELRAIGNEFAHYDHESIIGRQEPPVGSVIFVGDEPSEDDRAAIETQIKVDAASSLLALKAYRYAVRVCEKLIPARARS